MSSDSSGDMFLCIGGNEKSKKLLTNLDHSHLRCWYKCTGKGTTIAFLVDLRNIQKASLRDIERQQLKKGFERILSFKFTEEIKIRDSARILTVDEAFEEFSAIQTEKKKNRSVKKLVTQGYASDDSEARKALEMSLAEKSESKSNESQSEPDNDENDDKDMRTLAENDDFEALGDTVDAEEVTTEQKE